MVQPPVKDTPAQLEALHQYELRAEQQQDTDRQAHNDAVTPSYNFHYGEKNPFVPGNIQVEGKGFIQPGAFPEAEYCGTCHQEAYSQWRQALHSNAFRTPFYRTSVNISYSRTKRAASPLRGTATAATTQLGFLSGALTENSKIDRAQFDSDG